MAGKKISQLPSGSLISLPLSGLTAVVHSGITYQHTLNDLRQRLVDSGSHYFTGSQYINGNLTVDGSLTAHEYILSSSITNIEIQNVSGSSNFGNDQEDTHVFTGSMYLSGSSYITGSQRITDYLIVGLDIHTYEGDPEALHVSNTGSYNIAHLQGDNEYYAQLNITNLNSSSLSSTDIVATADNGNETVHFVNLGINSSTYNGGYVGYENDAYLLNVGKDLYLGTVGGTEHPAQVRLFANNSWENPQIVIHTGSHVTFNTNSLSDGYIYEFSGSVNLHHNLNVIGSTSGSYFTGSFIGDGSGLYNLPVQSTDVSMFLSSSTFASASASFDSRITSATNEQDLSYFATTGSNTFSGSQIVLGDFNIENNFQVFGDSILEGNTLFEGPLTASNGVYSNLIYPLSGSDTITIDSPNLNVDTITANSLVVTGSVSGDGFDRFATTGSNTFIGDQQITGSVYFDITDSDRNIYFSINGDTNTYIGTTMGSLTMFDGAGYIQLNAQNEDGSGNYAYLTLNANNDNTLFFAGDNTPGRVNASINLSTSGSFNISTDNNTATLLLDGVLYDAHLVSTSSFNSFTASVATTGSNDFVGDQTIDGILYLQDPGNDLGDTAQIVNNGDALILSAQDDRKITLSVYSGSVYEWQFGTDGDLTVPGSIILNNSSVIKDNANQSISFGVDAAESGQGTQSTALGSNAGQTDQGNGATAVGALAGNLEQGQSAVAVGALAGSTQQGQWSIAVGTQAGGIGQGDYSIAIGNLAGALNQASHSIVISALGSTLDNTTANSLKIAPIRNTTASDGILQYNNTTKEVSYSNDISNFVDNLVSTSSFNEFTSSQEITNGNLNDDINILYDTKLNTSSFNTFTASAATTGSNTFVGNQTINGSLIIEGVSEVLTIDGGFSGNRDFDYTSGSIFYLTGLTGNGTWNINNVPTTNDRGVTMTFVVEQGGTPYSGSAYSFDSTPVTVKWVDSTVPTGSANKTEVIGLTAFRVGSSWNVLGSLSTFGS